MAEEMGRHGDYTENDYLKARKSDGTRLEPTTNVVVDRVYGTLDAINEYGMILDLLENHINMLEKVLSTHLRPEMDEKGYDPGPTLPNVSDTASRIYMGNHTLMRLQLRIYELTSRIDA